MRPDDFNSPAFPGSDLPPSVVDHAVDNSGNDPLSVAARAPVHAPVAAEKPKPAPFCLDYVLHGQPITERHISVAHALSSKRRLESLGITPQTSTDPVAYREMQDRKSA